MLWSDGRGQGLHDPVGTVSGVRSRTMRLLALTLLATGCYTARSAAPDINTAWRGRARVDLEARIGPATQQAEQPDGNLALRWVGHGVNIKSLPSGHLDLKITPTSFAIDAAAKPGEAEKYEYTRALAIVAPNGTLLDVDAAVAAGFPPGFNAHTGLVMGLTAGMGGIIEAGTPLPSVGVYIGGMVHPRLALIGTYSLVNGEDAQLGYVMGHAWGLGVQYWVRPRLTVRGGPAAILHFDPGLENPTFSSGATGGVGFAIVRSGSFVLDVRADAVVSTATLFGMAGIGVNVN